MKLKEGCRLVMAGDSVTDCDRDVSARLGGNGSLGNGYVNIINAVLTGLTPEKKIMVVNRGVNGNTILDVKKRWEKDVMALRPDHVALMIGINDVWRQFDGVLTQEAVVTPEVYERTYQEIIERTQEEAEGIWILSPFMLEPNREDPMRRMVDKYGGIAKRTAEKYGYPFVNIQAAMDHFMEHLSSYILSADRVHPNFQGHMILAKTFLDAIQFDWQTTGYH